MNREQQIRTEIAMLEEELAEIQTKKKMVVPIPFFRWEEINNLLATARTRVELYELNVAATLFSELEAVTPGKQAETSALQNQVRELQVKLAFERNLRQHAIREKEDLKKTLDLTRKVNENLKELVQGPAIGTEITLQVGDKVVYTSGDPFVVKRATKLTRVRFPAATHVLRNSKLIWVAADWKRT